MHKIYFDNIIFSIQKSGGISVVWYELLNGISKYADFNIQHLNYKGFENNIFFKKVMFCFPQAKKSRLFERYRNLSLFEKKPFIFHSSYYRTCNNSNAINVTTVHDFTYEYFNHGLKKWLHIWQKHRCIKKSDVIICISENTKKDVLKFFPDLDPSKIKVVYNGVSDDYFVLPKHSELFSKKYGDYVLFVGSRASYKNFDLTVQAVARSRYNLVVVGPSLTEKEKDILKNNKMDTSRYYMVGRITNEELNSLYNHAIALIYPSSYEGFGIPVLEAQKAGCPVIAYNCSSIPEVIGETPLLMQEATAEEIVRCLHILEDFQVRASVIQKGLLNASRFSWKKMYEDIAIIYKNVLEKH